MKRPPSPTVKLTDVAVNDQLVHPKLHPTRAITVVAKTQDRACVKNPDGSQTWVSDEAFDKAGYVRHGRGGRLT